MKPRVIIESPYAGSISRNETYARRVMADSLARGEAPLAFHLLYTQALDDTKPEERKMGIAASVEWYHSATLVAVYQDYGISPGMSKGIDLAKTYNLPITYRTIGKNEEV